MQRKQNGLQIQSTGQLQSRYELIDMSENHGITNNSKQFWIEEGLPGKRRSGGRKCEGL